MSNAYAPLHAGKMDQVDVERVDPTEDHVARLVYVFGRMPGVPRGPRPNGGRVPNREVDGRHGVGSPRHAGRASYQKDRPHPTLSRLDGGYIYG